MFKVLRDSTCVGIGEHSSMFACVHFCVCVCLRRLWHMCVYRRACVSMYTSLPLHNTVGVTARNRCLLRPMTFTVSQYLIGQQPFLSSGQQHFQCYLFCRDCKLNFSFSKQPKWCQHQPSKRMLQGLGASTALSSECSRFLSHKETLTALVLIL